MIYTIVAAIALWFVGGCLTLGWLFHKDEDRVFDSDEEQFEHTEWMCVIAAGWPIYWLGLAGYGLRQYFREFRT